jgi:hypothetical protein
MKRKNVFFMCGNANQTTQMLQVARAITEHDCHFSPMYLDGKMFGVEFDAYQFDRLVESPTSSKHVEKCMRLLEAEGVQIDFRARRRDYDLVVTTTDLILPERFVEAKVVLVQEGAVDKENWFGFTHNTLWRAFRRTHGFNLRVSKALGLLRLFAGTSPVGSSDWYTRFCLMSEGFRQFFMRKYPFVDKRKFCVTGVPNFDHFDKYRDNSFPQRNFVLVCTSDMRELFRYENRKAFIHHCRAIAAGRSLIFKLHPNERFDRAIEEIRSICPNARIYTDGNAYEMIANCELLVTRRSSVVFGAHVLGKPIISDFSQEEIATLAPIQNGGASASKIADVCRELLE